VEDHLVSGLTKIASYLVVLCTLACSRLMILRMNLLNRKILTGTQPIILSHIEQVNWIHLICWTVNSLVYSYMWCHIYMIGIAWIDTVRCRPLSLTCKIGYRTLPGDVKVLARGSRNIWIMIWNIGRFIWFILLSWLQEQRYDQFQLWSNMYSLIIIHDCLMRCSFSVRTIVQSR
jgi:hypothetical protein